LINDDARMKNSSAARDDSRDDSASGIALAEEGQRRVVALARAVAAAAGAGDLDLARELVSRLAELLDGVQASLAQA
jgi:hypothetical protein